MAKYVELKGKAKIKILEQNNDEIKVKVSELYKLIKENKQLLNNEENAEKKKTEKREKKNSTKK